MTKETANLYGALGRIPSGLFVVTALRGSESTGMLASWVQQCAFEPPHIALALANDRFLLDWLTDDAEFAVNILGESQKSLVAHFGKGFASGENAFDGLEVMGGLRPPMLLQGHAYLACRVRSRTPCGDHTLVVGEVTFGLVLHEMKPATHVRKKGNHY